METQNSQGGLEPLTVVVNLFLDLTEWYPHLSKTFQRDIVEIQSRVDKEGLGFVTVAMPSFGKAIERGLETGKFSCPLGFMCRKGSSLPEFLRGLTNLLFDVDGSVRPEPDALALQALRQILLMVYKCDLPYAKAKVDRVVASFVENEEFIQKLEARTNGFTDFGHGEPTVVMAAGIVAQILEGFDPRDIDPRHGPGAVASGERGDQKWKFSTLYDSIHKRYPYSEFFFGGSLLQHDDREEEFWSFDRRETGIAKVCLVPKDSRGPRLISMEPLEYQWIQQGLGRKLVAHLELNRFTCGKINFAKQGVNRKLALESSRTKEFATLDLKDASDLVSLGLVRRLIPPHIMPYLEACRTCATELPDGRVLPLSKFAPMGSCLCFPVEALVFWAISVASVSIETGRSWRQIGARTYTYGDDLIVPSEYSYCVMSALSSVGLKVNTNKSYVLGEFRESCGMDAFRGVDVSIARMNQVWKVESSGAVLASFVALVNGLYEKGFRHGARRIRNAITTALGRCIPTGTSSSAGLCWRYTADGEPVQDVGQVHRACAEDKIPEKEHKAYQTWRFLAPVLVTKKRSTRAASWHRLLRNLVRGDMPNPEQETVRQTVLVWRFVKAY